jgi:CRISPR-associated protein Cas1
VQGNVLLRRAQHKALSDQDHTVAIARQMLAGKVQNTRRVLVRGRRETEVDADQATLQDASDRLAHIIEHLPEIDDLNELRGAEGEAARHYFGVLSLLLRQEDFRMEGRTRRPPRDPFNSLLSFLYTLLCSECAAAAEAVGLDPQVGYLHALRSGRPALALDLMEELRPFLADRLALTLLNRRQLQQKHFERRPGGAVYLTEKGREILLDAYQKRKQVELTHRPLDRKIPIGLLPHVQATLLARHLRSDLTHYPPYLYR